MLVRNDKSQMDIHVFWILDSIVTELDHIIFMIVSFCIE